MIRHLISVGIAAEWLIGTAPRRAPREKDALCGADIGGPEEWETLQFLEAPSWSGESSAVCVACCLALRRLSPEAINLLRDRVRPGKGEAS